MAPDRRLRLVVWILAAVWGVLVLRAAHVQILQHERWEAEARSAQQAIDPVPARRGEIRTTSGDVLASTVLNRSLAVDPQLVDPEEAEALAAALDSLGLARRDWILGEIAEHRASRFVWINRDILPETDLARLLERFDCLVERTEGKRLYPLGTAGGAVVGVLGRDEMPLGGLEVAFDEKLKGRAGRRLRVRDATGKVFRGIHVQPLEDPVAGSDLEVAIHARIQEIAAARLQDGVEREGASGGYCIVTRPSTGEILAMASAPVADPAENGTWRRETLECAPVTVAFEPGSSYKLVAFAAALEAGLFHRDEPIDCMNGGRTVPGGRAITDHHPLGVVPAWEVFAHSSNIGSGILAERAGAERFYRMEKALGFGLPTGIELPGEGRGRIPEPSSPAWSARSLVTMAFGQEVSCTTIQMAMAYGAVANGGNLMRPLLVRSVRGPDGLELERWDPEVVRPALRPSVAREMRELMRLVVSEGTGNKAEIEALRPAGKTSTAQKYISEERSYSTRRYVASFVGFAPYDDPQILCIVVLDEPTSSIYGGNVAAPIFREIVEDTWPFLEGGSRRPGAAPVRWVAREADPRRAIPSVEGLDPALARRLLEEEGLLARMQGEGPRVVSMSPAPGERVLPSTVVTIVRGGGESGGADECPMPDLLGLSLRDAWLRARSAGSVPEVEGTGWVVAQYPEPGTPVTAGAACRLTLGPDSSRAWKEFLEGEHPAWAVAGGDLLVGASR